jgi:MerR family transcriptional regulator, light-induced transcriptional regulator
MPVATLRIWEQRYQAVAPATTTTGHRLYSQADVERVVLLRDLTTHGHSIRSLAPLSTEQLRALVWPSRSDTKPPVKAPIGGRAPLSVVVVGSALARRLDRPAVHRRWSKSPWVLAVYPTLGEAANATNEPDLAPFDLLLWQTPALFESNVDELVAAQKALRPSKTAVVYRFTAANPKERLAALGVTAIQEPNDDVVLAEWISALEAELMSAGADIRPLVRVFDPWSTEALGLPNSETPVRRFDDATLTEFAGMSSNVACECPKHLAELLIQIAGFEAYSAQCENRSSSDAALHRYLNRVAGAARVLFEAALERVAVEEGLRLPRSVPASSSHPASTGLSTP